MRLQNLKAVGFISVSIIIASLSTIIFLIYLDAQKYVCEPYAQQYSQILIPSFSVSVSLSEKARAKLQSLQEGVKVSIVFDGDGTPEPGEMTAPHRDVFLCHTERQIDYHNAVIFSDLAFPTERFRRLSGPDYYVSVNVFSARLSHPDNILSCNFAGEPISLASRKGLNLHCRLIEEEDLTGK